MFRNPQILCNIMMPHERRHGDAEEAAGRNPLHGFIHKGAAMMHCTLKHFFSADFLMRLFFSSFICRNFASEIKQQINKTTKTHLFWQEYND